MLQTDNENLAEPWPYSRRSGSGIDADIAALLAPAAISLTEQEHDEVAAFNKTLLSGALTEINKPLEAVDKISLLSRTATFYNGYFATSEAAGKVVNQDDLYQKVATGDEVETTSLGTIAEASAKWHREAITADLGTSAQFEQNPPLDSTVTRVNFDPAATINKFSQLQHFRMAYRAVRQTLNEADGPTTEAKSTLLDVQ
ncbi:MAG TPA: hypothetical protein VF598_13075, partial [Hymenobacter sp.]